MEFALQSFWTSANRSSRHISQFIMHRRTDDGSRMNVWLICNHLPMDFLWQMNEWANVKSIENCINRMTGIATHHGWLVQTKRPKMHCMYYMYTNKKKMFEKEAEMNVECTLISPEIRYFANNHRNRTTYELWNRNEECKHFALTRNSNGSDSGSIHKICLMCVCSDSFSAFPAHT